MAAAGVASRSGALASCSRQAAVLSVRSVSLVPVALLTQRCSPSQRGYGAQRPVVLPAPAQRATCTRRIGAVSVQASLVARVARIARAYLGGASDSLLSSLERPELMITQAVEEMSSDLTKAKQAYVRVLADHRLAQRRARVAADSVDTWQRRAEQAVQKGEDELAREALKRKRTAMEEKGLAEAQAADLEAAANTLGESIKVLAGRVAEARAKERGLVARARAAEVQAAQQAALAELVAGLPQPGTAWAEFDRMEAKVGEMEALAAAKAEVAGSGSLLGSGGSNNDAGRRLLAMDADARLDAELEAIKRGLTAHQQPQRALPPFQSSR